MGVRTVGLLLQRCCEGGINRCEWRRPSNGTCPPLLLFVFVKHYTGGFSEQRNEPHLEVTRQAGHRSNGEDILDVTDLRKWFCGCGAERPERTATGGQQ